MKKLIAIMLVMLCAMSLVACGDKQDSVEEPVAAIEETVTPIAE